MADFDLLRRVPWMRDELVALHRYVGAVTLPDICNGYFLHDLTTFDWPDRADQIGKPLDERIDVIVFGSNGGGDLYAIPVTDGRVFRMQDAGYVDGVYNGTDRGIVVVGADLRDFLSRLLSAVTAFAATGAITDL